MPHLCHGRLCDICRARILQLILGNSEKKLISHREPNGKTALTQGKVQRPRNRATDSESHQNLCAEDILNLLEILADTVTSRSMKEQLHSRLLSDSFTKAEVIEGSIRDLEMLSSLENRKPEPLSHFSSSSDNDITEGSNPGMGYFNTSSFWYSGVSYGESKMAKAKELHISNGVKAEDQDVFDLEL